MACLAWCLVWCLFGLTGCAGTPGGAGQDGKPGSVERGRIELPEPDPVPGLASDEWSPPPVWLVSGGRIVQGSYGEFCKLDDCTGMETPEQMGEDLARMRVSGDTFVVVGSDRVSGFAAGTKEWSGETEEPPVPGVYTEPGVPPDLRRLDGRRVPEGSKPTVVPAAFGTADETTAPEAGEASGGPSVFELVATGGPGDRRLSVFLGLGKYDRAVYHWRLDPGRETEITTSEASPETTSATLEELTSAPEETTTLSSQAPAFRGVEMRPVGDSPTGVAAGEGYLWVLDRGDAETSLLKLDPETGETLAASDVPDTSSGLEAGAGAVWLLEEDTGSVLRLDRASGEVEHRVRVGDSSSEVVAARGAVWVAASDDEKGGRVVRIDPQTARVVAEIETSGAVESVTVDGARGDIWAVSPDQTRGPEGHEDGQLLRIDPASNRVSQRLAVPGGVSDAVAGDGAVWAIDPDGDLLKIDPSGRRIEVIIPLDSPGPHEMAFGAGAVWIAGVDVLTRVDPDAALPAGSLKVGPYGAEDVAVGKDHVWTTGPGADRGGTLTRVTP